MLIIRHLWERPRVRKDVFDRVPPASSDSIASPQSAEPQTDWANTEVTK